MKPTTQLPHSAILWAIAIAALHALAAYAFAMETPYRTAGFILGQRGPDGGPTFVQDIGAPDERQHANYVARLVDGEGIPVFNPKDPDLYESYQAHQPPLYYVLGAGWAKAIGLTGDGIRSSTGTPLRYLNAGLGAITVFGTFFLAWWGFRQQLVAIGSAGLVAFLPMNVALSGSVGNDPLLIALCTWVLAFVAKVIRDGCTWPLAIAMAVGTGAAILTKTTAISLLPIVMLGALMSIRKPTVSQLATASLLILAMVVPWWLRNQQLYGDPLALKAFNQAFTGSPQASAFIADIGPTDYWTKWVGWWTVRSFIGVFGYMDIWLTNTGSQSGIPHLYLVCLAPFAVGGLGWFGAVVKSDRAGRFVHLVNAVFTLSIGLLFLRFNSQYFQAQARYLLPAIAPICVGVASGLAVLFGSRARLALGVATGLLAMATTLAIVRLPGEFNRRTEASDR